MNKFPKITSISPNINPNNNPLEPIISASSFLCSPRRLEIVLPDHIPIQKDTACIRVIRENTIPVAPDALVPSFETKYVSAAL